MVHVAHCYLFCVAVLVGLLSIFSRGFLLLFFSCERAFFLFSFLGLLLGPGSLLRLPYCAILLGKEMER